MLSENNFKKVNLRLKTAISKGKKTCLANDCYWVIVNLGIHKMIFCKLAKY
jgi:hypothetical protein